MGVNTADLTKEQNTVAITYVLACSKANSLESEIARFERRTKDWLDYAYREWRKLNNEAKQAERDYFATVPDAEARLT